jgi:hypothetical protein
MAVVSHVKDGGSYAEEFKTSPNWDCSVNRLAIGIAA